MMFGMSRKRKAAVALAIAVVAILVVASLWIFVIPRTEIRVMTVYREGSTGIINVHVKLENRGTVNAEQVNVHVLVMNSTRTFLDESDEVSQISPRDAHEFKMHYVGNQHEDYVIEVTVDFDTESEHFSQTFTYTPGNYMTEVFEETIEKVHL